MEIADRTKLLSEEDYSGAWKRSLRGALAGQASLLVYHRGGAQIVPLTEGNEIVIGRAPPSDVVVRDDWLSLQHAAVLLKKGEVWVEDLGSTNGTWIEQKRTERAKVAPGTSVVFGAVRATVQLISPVQSRRHGFFDHDLFVLDLQAETIRAKVFERKLALLMLRGDGDTGRWLSLVLERLRPYDRIALYSSDTAEVLLPEDDVEQAHAFAVKLTKADPGLCVGFSVLPDNASSPEELIEAARCALLNTDERQRVYGAPSTDTRTLEPSEASAGDHPVVTSEVMKQVFKMAQRVASSTIPVLLVGETGTGKELVAEAVHRQGGRSGHKMVCVNCGAIPKDLVESTLFGHEKGSFTGATQRSAGVFESADGGTVFLDEVGELPLPAQAALLRVLESQRFSRVGSTREMEVDVRIVAATHRDLSSMSDEGTFREDLYFRLNAMTIEIPPLRARAEEVVPLAERFMAESSRSNGRDVNRISAEALALLERYHWPGNVRELRNAIERATVLAEGHSILPDDLPTPIRSLAGTIPAAPHSSAPQSKPSGAPEDVEGTLKARVARYEARILRDTMEAC